MKYDPKTLLEDCVKVMDQRGLSYGGVEDNFQLIADIATLKLGRSIHPYEVCVFLECVKEARAFHDPTHYDNHVDSVNYRAFAAMFADDYAARRNPTGADVSYKTKDTIRRAEVGSHFEARTIAEVTKDGNSRRASAPRNSDTRPSLQSLESEMRLVGDTIRDA